MNLFQIDSRIENIFDNMAVDPETGEVIYDSDELDGLQMEQEQKRKNIALLLKNLDSDIAALKAQEETFEQRREAKEKRRDWLKKYLMLSLKGEDFECAEVSVKHKKNPPKAVWDKDKTESIIKWLKRHKLGSVVTVKTTTSIDKNKLKAAIKGGAKIPDVSLVSETTITY